MSLEEFRALAESSEEAVAVVLDLPEYREALKEALRIRAVEESLLDLFGRGKLHGTIHTCIGEEFSGVAIGRKLRHDDFITSNHRCHGHFIAATKNWQGLIDEIVGNKYGVCGGVGSSQHLYSGNFLSNGPQGALLPVAAGIALDRKRRGSDGVAISFTGEGTLGEGVLYETLNLDALWQLPHLVVCENNLYSQSTPQALSVSGEITERAAAFGINTFIADTWNVPHLFRVIDQIFDEYLRRGEPAFLHLRTYRLRAHSKGDDPRDPKEISCFEQADPLNVAMRLDQSMRDYYVDCFDEAIQYGTEALEKPKLVYDDYAGDQLPRGTSRFVPYLGEETRRQHEQLTHYYGDRLGDPRCYFIGEDIADPYGGAFKISKGFTTAHPDRALTTPISEAAITGVGIGLAVAGNRPFVEIMFGDFISYAFSQILDNASKFHHMYYQQVDCPVVVRTPMGGRRGYGPTHSQSLERFFLGMPNVAAVAVNSIVSIEQQLGQLNRVVCPVVLFENKADYTLRPYQVPDGFGVEVNEEIFPTIRVAPANSPPTHTVVAYGGVARLIADNLLRLFEEADALIEMIVPTLISPLDIEPIVESVRRTGRLVTIEEGNPNAGVGAEVIAQVATRLTDPFRALKVGSANLAIPSVPVLEDKVLPNLGDLIVQVSAMEAL